MNNEFDDIINLPHHVSKNHPQMLMSSRAAQFAPFAALTGHEEAIENTAKDNETSYIVETGNEYEDNLKEYFEK